MLLKGLKTNLRAMEPSDIDILFSWENNTDNWHISNVHAPFSKHILEQFVNSENDIFTHKQMRFIICENKFQKPIGAIDLFEFDPLNWRAGIGILVAEKENRNKGYAKEALELIIQYSFELLRLNQLFCNIEVENTGSLQLFQGLGFQISGTKKNWNLKNGNWKDEHFLQLLNQ